MPTRSQITARQEEGRLVGEGSKQEREADVRRICGHLAGEVAKLAPPGTGRRDDVWEAVAEPDRALTLALTTWKLTGAEADKATARTAYRTLLDAWRDALSRANRSAA